jgi:beta-lactam-binding protein with PASTA domain
MWKDATLKNYSAISIIVNTKILPDFTKYNQEDAIFLAENLGISNQLTINGIEVEKGELLGRVKSQNINQGTPLTEVNSLTLDVSSGYLFNSRMPLILGLSKEKAIQKLKKISSDITIVELPEEQSDIYERGKVMIQTPSAGESINPDSQVTIKVSSHSVDSRASLELYDYEALDPEVSSVFQASSFNFDNISCVKNPEADITNLYNSYLAEKNNIFLNIDRTSFSMNLVTFVEANLCRYSVTGAIKYYENSVLGLTNASFNLDGNSSVTDFCENSTLEATEIDLKIMDNNRFGVIIRDYTATECLDREVLIELKGDLQ